MIGFKPLEVPMLKWEHITMDFITKLPRMSKGLNVIWVIVGRLTKSAYFHAIRQSFSSEKLADIYIREVVARYGAYFYSLRSGCLVYF